MAFVVLFPVPGLFPHFVVYPATGWSPAVIACPFVCAGCSPSAKIFTWGDKGHRWQRGKGRNGYAFVCKNPDVDLASVSDGNIVALAKSEALQPYMLDGIVAWALESVVAIIVLTPLVAAALRLRQRRP